MLHHPSRGKNLLPRSRLHKNFRHVPSSTGEPRVRRPYTYAVSPSKAGLRKLSCPLPVDTEYFPVRHRDGNCFRFTRPPPAQARVHRRAGPLGCGSARVAAPCGPRGPPSRRRRKRVEP
ncbi:hypothetical protein SNL152K_9249 [Streptomyces sp. NL15-2K]|nr:hypothetical protein SNL152K_9249 [Streptomyces sp. NL15-2K]